MGLCLSKRDVLIHKPHHSDQFLGIQGLQHFHQHQAGIFVPNSPSVSVVSTEVSSVAAAERHLLKNYSTGSTATTPAAGTMRSSSASNAAECGSLRDWRAFHRNSSANSMSSSVRNFRASVSDADLDDLASGCGGAAPRSSGFSYLSSPMVEAMDVCGIDTIARSYVKARQRFELDSNPGGSVPNPRLLEIEEEHEEQHGDGSEYTSPCSGIVKKKSHGKSLHVFGEIFGESNSKISKMATTTTTTATIPSMPAIPSIRVVDSSPSSSFSAAAAGSSKRSFELSVFGDDIDRHKVVDFDESSRDLGGGSIIADQPQHSVHVRSARWGFVLDSCGADEMEGGEELSRMSTSVEPICKASISATNPFISTMKGPNFSSSTAFMAMAAGSSSREAWNHANVSFSHMNPPVPAAAAAATDSSLPRASDDGSSSTDFSSSSRDLSSNLHSCRGMPRKFVPIARNSSLSSSDDMYSTSSAAFFQRSDGRDDDDDDGRGDSDSSDDLFEIDNLGKDFLLYPMNSAFLQDPDISYSSTSNPNKSSMGCSIKPMNSAHFQQAHGHGSILGPTLRANVLVTPNSSSSNVSSSRHRSSSSTDFQQPRKSVKGSRRKSSNSFYGISSTMENDQSFYAR